MRLPMAKTIAVLVPAVWLLGPVTVGVAEVTVEMVLLPPPQGTYSSTNTVTFPSTSIELVGMSLNGGDAFALESAPPPATGVTLTTNSRYNIPYEGTMGHYAFNVNQIQTVSIEWTTFLQTPVERMIDAEIVSMDLTGGPASPLRFRESPTIASTGMTCIYPAGKRGWAIDSFFDISFEASTDGGTTWKPASGPMTFELDILGPVPIAAIPQLNWTFLNLTGQSASGLVLVVDNPEFNPITTSPEHVVMGPFTNTTITRGDFDGDGDQDSKVTFSGGAVATGAEAHVGLFMNQAGAIIDGYWIDEGQKIGLAVAGSDETPRIRRETEIHMELALPPGYFNDDPDAEAGWTNIRGYVGIPQAVLSLADIDGTLDPSVLEPYRVQPYLGEVGVPGHTGVPILPADFLFLRDGDPPLDIYLGAGLYSADYEALLVAELRGPDPMDQIQIVPLGEFWNLSRQAPEPATAVLLALGAVALVRRRRRAL